MLQLHITISRLNELIKNQMVNDHVSEILLNEIDRLQNFINEKNSKQEQEVRAEELIDFSEKYGIYFRF